MGLYFDMIAAKTGITHVLGKDHFSLSLSDLILGRCFFYQFDLLYHNSLTHQRCDIGWMSFINLICFRNESHFLKIQECMNCDALHQRTSSRVLALHEKYARGPHQGC